jgi:hypothetical protein
VLLRFSITRALPGVLALLIGVAGWFYLFYSRAAENLSSIEDQRLNVRRTNLRRLGALIMLTLAVLISVGSYGYDLDRPTISFFVIWLCVIVLLMVVVILALVDLRLTVKLRHAFKRRREET